MIKTHATFKFALLITTMICFVSCAKLEKYKPQGKLVKTTQFHPLWIKNHDPSYVTGNLPIALNSPLIHEDIVYSGSNDGYFKAYDIKTGRIIWQFNEGGQYHSTPTAYKDFILYGDNQGRLYSRHAITGKLNFSVDLGATIESKVTIYKDRLFVQLRNHQIMSLDAISGKIIWGYKRSVPYLTTIQGSSTPFLYNNIVYVGFADSYVAAFSMEEGVLLWENKLSSGTKFVDTDLSPILFDNNLIIGPLADKLYLINPKNGRINGTLDYKASRSPVTYNQGLIVPTKNGELIVLGPKLEEVERKRISENSISSVEVLKDKILVSTIGPKVFALNKVSFDIIDSFHLGHKVSAVFGAISTDPEEKYFSLISSRNRLYLFAPDTPKF